MASLDDIVGGAGADGSTDEVAIDFSGAVDFEALPKGTYRAKVLSCTPGLSKEKKVPQLKWVFVVTEEPYVGRQVSRYSPTTGKGSGITKMVMKGLGFETSEGKTSFKPSQAVDRECLLVLEVDSKNSDFNDVKRVLPIGEAVASSPLG